MAQNSWVHDYLVKRDIDIAIVLETWYCEDANMPQFHESMIANGYRIKCIANAVKFNDNVGGRYAGGIWVMCKDEWYDKIIAMDTDSPYYVIFKICELNLYCIGIYITIERKCICKSIVYFSRIDNEITMFAGY